jgi:hypothetical protein
MSFNLNAPERIYKMERKFKEGKWKNGKPKEIRITYPKPRDGLSIPFEDRVYQRSINDLILYPSATKSFIYANCACQKGKGIDFARKLVKKYLRKHYINNGLDGYVLQIDVSGYYPNMRHEEVDKIFRKCLNDVDYKMVCDVLNTQYEGDVGYNPGSQMVQIAGISLLDPIDHFIKEKLGIKNYIRYMDDFFLLHESKEYLEYCLAKIESKLNEIGFSMNPKKTHIKPLKDGFLFLGFHYHVTKTGKIIMTLNSENIRHERKKLYRQVQLLKKNEITQDKIDDCFEGWANNASKGNSCKLIKRTKEYLKKVEEEST